MAQVVPQGRDRRLGARPDQRARPLRRGRPARRRGRRRLRRRGAPPRRGHRRGARRPGRRRCPPAGWRRKELAAAGRRHAQPAGPRGGRGARAGALRRARCAPRSTTSPRSQDPVDVQRVHGDFHLGQVMRTLDGWKLLDFEGEPARPLAERRGLESPLKDVAGMLRSFDYAARHLLADHPRRPAARVPRHGVGRAQPRRLLRRATPGQADADPRSQPVLLRAFETDKAVYEVLYEARNRPTWLQIPMAAIRRLAGRRRASETRDLEQVHRVHPYPLPATAPGTRAAPASLPVSAEELHRLVSGTHHDPHSLLGPHPHDGGVTVRTLRPWATAVTVVVGDATVTRCGTRATASGSASCRTRTVPDYRLEVAYDGPPRTRRRPLPLPADARRDRPAPHRRGPPRGAVARPRRAHPLVRRHRRPRARHVVRRVGAQRPGRAPDRRLQLLGRPRAPDARDGLDRRLGAVRPGASATAPTTSSRCSARTACGGRRPTRSPSAPRSRPRPRRSCSPPTYEWGDDEWLRAARRDRPADHAR